MVTHPLPYVKSAAEHQRLMWLGRTELTVVVDGAASGGALMVVEVRAQKGDAAPVHVHSREEEAFLVLEGAMTVWVGDDKHHIGPGGVGLLPRDIPHAYTFAEDNSRALNICTPAGLEDFFRAAGWDKSTTPPADWAITPQTLGAAAARFGLTIVGPPRSEG